MFADVGLGRRVCPTIGCSRFCLIGTGVASWWLGDLRFVGCAGSGDHAQRLNRETYPEETYTTRLSRATCSQRLRLHCGFVATKGRRRITSPPALPVVGYESNQGERPWSRSDSVSHQE